MKLKTHKASAKRMKLSVTGKVLRVKAAKSHLLTHKANPTKTLLELSHADVKKVKKLLPYN
ncbi:MAG: 50S ribosomal protein L35 [Candidatus Berkelbacteria bacterium]|nr:50S ribosomal protein L35 [Candidatus Berkelbacteria bacterium]